MHCQLHEIPPSLRGSSKRVADAVGSVRSKDVPNGCDHASNSDTVARFGTRKPHGRKGSLRAYQHPRVTAARPCREKHLPGSVAVRPFSYRYTDFSPTECRLTLYQRRSPRAYVR